MVLRARTGVSTLSSSSRASMEQRHWPASSSSERAGGPKRRNVCLTTAMLSMCALLLFWVVSNWMSGVQGLLSVWWAWPGIEGVPKQCGSDGRSSWMWMNPASFNQSFSRTTSKKPGPFFLVGCGHSGTTPLLALLATHPQVWAYTPNDALEYSVKPNSFRNVARASSMLPPVVFSKEDDKIFRQLAKKSKKSVKRWLVKSPSNVCRLGYIFSTLGRDAPTVALVRDGRDVMISLLERYPDEDPGGPLVLGRWANDNTALLLYQRDPRLQIVRYEDLFLQPPHYPTLRKLLRHAHLDESPLDQMLADYGKSETKRRRKSSLRTSATASKEHTRLRQNQTSQPFRRAPPRWPVQMTPELAAIFVQNQVAYDLLDYFDYLDTSQEAWTRLLSTQPAQKQTLSFFSKYVRGKKQVQFKPLPLDNTSPS